MKCNKVRELLVDYLKGNLESPQAAVICEHLNHCNECREELAFLKQYFAYLQKTHPISSAPDFMVRLNERIDSEESPKKQRFRLSPPVLGLAGAVVVMCLLALAVVNPSIFVAPKSRPMGNPLSASSLGVLDSTVQSTKEYEVVTTSEDSVEETKTYIMSAKRSAKGVQNSSTVIITLKVASDKSESLLARSTRRLSESSDTNNDIMAENMQLYGDKKEKQKAVPEIEQSEAINLKLDETASMEAASTIETAKSRIISELFADLSGKILEEDYRSDTGLLQKISGSLPAKNYSEFVTRLSEYGIIESINNLSTMNGKAIIPIEVRFLD
jgi:hypothetical protein